MPDLLSKANAAALRFIKTELETGLNFARMAAIVRNKKKARPSDAAKVKRYVGYAHEAYAIVSGRLGTVRCEREELRAIKEKIAELQKMHERS